jgi:hypothetical protein
MSPNLATISDGKKFLWDGQMYPSLDEASRAEQTYQKDNFEVRLVEQDGKVFLYTRRAVKEAAVTES